MFSQQWPTRYVVLQSYWISAPKVGGISSIEHPCVKSSLSSRFVLIFRFVSYNRMMNCSRRHLVSSFISSGPLLNVIKASVTLLNDFCLSHAVFFPIALQNDTLSQAMNAWNTDFRGSEYLLCSPTPSFTYICLSACRFHAATARTRTSVLMVHNKTKKTVPWSIGSMCSSILVSTSSWSQGDRCSSKSVDFGFVVMLSQEVITSCLQPSIWVDFA